MRTCTRPLPLPLVGISNYIPAKSIQNLIHIFGGTDLLNAIVFEDIRVISSSETRKSAVIIIQFPMWNGSIQNPRLVVVRHTPGVWSTALQCRQLPPFSLKVSSDQQIGNAMPILSKSQRCQHSDSLFNMGQQIGTTLRLPEWVEKDLLDRASKKGKGQQPKLLGGLHKTSEQHVSLKAGRNDEAQITVAQSRAVTTGRNTPFVMRPMSAFASLQ